MCVPDPSLGRTLRASTPRRSQLMQLITLRTDNTDGCASGGAPSPVSNRPCTETPMQCKVSLMIWRVASGQFREKHNCRAPSSEVSHCCLETVRVVDWLVAGATAMDEAIDFHDGMISPVDAVRTGWDSLRAVMRSWGVFDRADAMVARTWFRSRAARQPHLRPLNNFCSGTHAGTMHDLPPCSCD